MLPESVEREMYYNVKNNPNLYDKWYRSAILLFASYNAKVYDCGYGAMAKTKDGKIRNYYKESLNNYKKQIPKLKNIKFNCQDYKELKCKNCVIYCDIPYGDTTKYRDNFNNDEFWQWAREMSQYNVVLVSEYDAPDDFECIWQKEVVCHLNNRNKLNKVEKLFKYKNLNHFHFGNI